MPCSCGAEQLKQCRLYNDARMLAKLAALSLGYGTTTREDECEVQLPLTEALLRAEHQKRGCIFPADKVVEPLKIFQHPPKPGDAEAATRLAE